MPLEHGQGLVHGVALGNSAQVQPHALLEQFDGLVPGVQLDQLVTHEVPGLPQGLGRGKLLLPPRPPPEPHHRPDGHVEGPAALLGNVLGMFQDLPQFGADRDGLPLARGIAEPPQFALRIVIAEDAVQGVDPGKGIFGRRSCGFCIGRIQYDLDRNGHFDLGELETAECRFARRRGRHSHPQQPHPNNSAQQSHFPTHTSGRGSSDFSLFHSSTFEVSMIRLWSIRSLRQSIFWILVLVGIVAGMYLRTAAGGRQGGHRLAEHETFAGRKEIAGLQERPAQQRRIGADRRGQGKASRPADARVAAQAGDRHSRGQGQPTRPA